MYPYNHKPRTLLITTCLLALAAAPMAAYATSQNTETNHKSQNGSDMNNNSGSDTSSESDTMNKHEKKSPKHSTYKNEHPGSENMGQ